MGQGKEHKWAIAVRLSEADLNLLDALVKLFTDGGDGVIEYTRSDVIRRAIRQLAEKHSRGKKGKTDGWEC